MLHTMNFLIFTAMKTLLLFILCISCWTQSFSQSEINLTPEQEEEAWEFIRQRFFPQGFNEFYYPGKFYENINYHLTNGTEKEIAFLKNLIEEINPSIPYKAQYVNHIEDANFIIQIIDPEKWTEWKFQNTETGNKNGYYNNEILKQHYLIAFPNETSTSKRLEVIQYAAVTGLTDAGQRFVPYIHSSFLQAQESIFFPRKYNLDINKEYPEFKPIDKFYLSKIYNPNLDQQLKEYVKDKYGYWFYVNFKFSKPVVSLIKGIFLMLLFLIIISLTFRTVLTRKYASQLTGYLINGTFIVSIALFFFFLDSHLLVYEKDHFNYAASQQLYTPSFREFFLLTSIIIGLTLLFSLSLFFLDRFLLKKNQNIFHKALIRMFNFIIISAMGILLFFLVGPKTSYWDLIISGLYFLLFGFVRSIFLFFQERTEDLLRKKDIEVSRLMASKAEAKVASLHARINPHFLYNSLNSIAGLAHIDADKTEKMALSLSDLFRHNLNRTNKPFCTIQEEIEATKAYMEIEQIRFGNKLEFSTEIDESLYDFLIPRNIIQPLLENAIKHGVSQLKTTGKIKLQIIESGENIQISVYDNGPAFQEGSISGYGLQSIFDILNLTYKNKAELSRENTPEKRVWISISKNELKKAAK